MNDSEEQNALCTVDNLDNISLEEMHRRADRELESLHKLNNSFVQKAKKYEIQANVLLAENEFLVQRNVDLTTQTHFACDMMRNLSVIDAGIARIKSNYDETTSSVSSLKQATNEMESRLSVVIKEQNALQSEFLTLSGRVFNLHRELEAAVATTNTRTRERIRVYQEPPNPTMIRDRTGHATKAKSWPRSRGCWCKVEEPNKQSICNSPKNNGAFEASQRHSENIEAKSDSMSAILNSVLKEHTIVEKMRSAALEKKSELERKIDTLRKEREELQNRICNNDADVSFINSAIRVTTKERNSVHMELNSKQNEAHRLVAEIATIQEKRAELIRQCHELEISGRSAQKDVDSTIQELDTRKRMTQALVAERNLLETEKACIERDFTDARNRSMLLERAKGLLRRRVLELEATKLKLSRNIEALKQGRHLAISAHKEELHERLAEKVANIKKQTNTLHEELFAVLSRHAGNNHKNLKVTIVSPKAAMFTVENKDIDHIEHITPMIGSSTKLDEPLDSSSE